MFTADGRRVVDAISSWWVITHGHRHPRIVAAIREAADNLDQVIFAEYTHEPAERLAEKLLAVAAPGLAHVFFSDSGSTSVEVALKMALGYWRHHGEPRHRILVMEHSYHGDTVGAMSVGERGPFTEVYDPLLFDVARIPFPAAGRESVTFEALEAQCDLGDAAAFIVEPLVLGAGGMLMYSPAVLGELANICARHGVLFIADEVMTGWGRTGTMFACRAGRHLARHRLLFEGSHRRLVAARRDALPARDFCRALRSGPTPHLLSLKLVHRQSDCLRRGARQSADLGVGARARAHRGA